MNTKLLYIFIKNNVLVSSNSNHALKTLPFTSFLFWKFFTKTFFAFIKTVYTRNMGIMTINLTKSFLYKTFTDVDSLLLSKHQQVKSNTQKYSLHSVKYLQPITIISFAFQKKTYDTLMLYIMFLLVDNYSSNKNSFKLYYSFLLKTPNFTLYPFLNLFYFKLRQF